VTHGWVRSRCFRLSLAVNAPGTLRIEAADPRGDRPPQPRTNVTATAADLAAESGHALFLVETLAADGAALRTRPSGKTVRAHIHLG
jgi:hypothetical protein